MEKKQLIQDYFRQFKLGALSRDFEQILEDAEKTNDGYIDFTFKMLKAEAINREQKDMERRLKSAQLPINHDISNYDYTCENGLSKSRLNQLKELNWLDKLYNIILMGPSGTGKTYIAAGLCHQAVKNGYKAYFRSMGEIIDMLKMKDVTRTAMADYKRLTKADLIVIDDIMLFPVEKQLSVNLFNFINLLYENTAFIITTNKAPKQWAQMLNDEVLATAMLDRLLFRCEVINLLGKSYRLKNRKTIFV
jgi:DNA replication protein DnaC